MRSREKQRTAEEESSNEPISPDKTEKAVGEYEVVGEYEDKCYISSRYSSLIHSFFVLCRFFLQCRY